MEDKNKAGINLDPAKTDEYKEVLNNVIKSEKCPFCPDNFKFHKERILKKQNDWLITFNSWPYENSKYHFIIIPNSHKENFQDLTVEDFKTIQELVNFVIEKYEIKGGGLTLRFGDQKHTGSTVQHLHLHLIVPEFDDNGKATPVFFPIG